MPETEADRILRERRRQEEAQERRKQAEAAHQVQIRSVSNIQRVEAEIPIVLKLLAKHHYPYMEQVRVRWLSFGPLVFKAAWRIGGYERSFDRGGEGTYTTPVYLLSDGRLYTYDSGTDVVSSPSALLKRYGCAEACLGGLLNLRSKLEELDK